MYRNVLFLMKKISLPTTSHSLHGTSYGITFSCVCVCWYSNYVAHYFIALTMSAFIFTQYTYYSAESLVFSMPILLLCNCSSICLCNRKGIIILLPSWQCHQLLLAHAWLANYSACFIPLHLLYMASHVLCTILAFAGLHPVRLPPVYFL